LFLGQTSPGDEFSLLAIQPVQSSCAELERIILSFLAIQIKLLPRAIATIQQTPFSQVSAR